ncbi:enamine deaminase RidA (YjgF/YER057c/UK114 family) [Kineococcus xinjiangensis]|uniref:Enamine deaminase RidA (YjgF/YER057c/UK114 family) n=1 Tax=Kineococcus xinjiangensis TaxID=512762 RepID=A0A2S6IM00_9ACTN|nr:Rid family hydrolase [Kineococcus xinjiangensis]PPK95201.1 enamine deaminase RidA (YjgF/YER057c/UK114 family) [Kineococcus xinjiangensis]
MSGVRRISSGGPWEAAYGYSRAVLVPGGAARVLVSGCTAVVDGQVQAVGDARGQTLIALGVAEAALREAGSGLEHAVRTRMYVVGREHCDAVGLAHGERLGAARPAASMLLVSGLVDERMLVEVEVEAVVPA